MLSGSFISSEIIAAADRDEPDINKIVKRIYAYSCSFNNNYKVIHPIDNRNALKRTYEHLVDKYSRTGYARYNLLYNNFYGSKLKELWDIIDNITIQDIIKILENKN